MASFTDPPPRPFWVGQRMKKVRLPGALPWETVPNRETRKLGMSKELKGPVMRHPTVPVNVLADPFHAFNKT